MTSTYDVPIGAARTARDRARNVVAGQGPVSAMISIERITWVRPLARLACSLGLLAAACGDDTVQPPPVAHVSLALRVEAVGSSLDPRHRIVATVTNDGNLPVLWWLLGPDHTSRSRRPSRAVTQADCLYDRNLASNPGTRSGREPVVLVHGHCLRRMGPG
jgi:hypothetical protein